MLCTVCKFKFDIEFDTEERNDTEIASEAQNRTENEPCTPMALVVRDTDGFFQWHVLSTDMRRRTLFPASFFSSQFDRDNSKDAVLNALLTVLTLLLLICTPAVMPADHLYHLLNRNRLV
ncbi:MAG: hypothetical protein MHM6MM_001892 [Cercozoa sp. M6MM]